MFPNFFQIQDVSQNTRKKLFPVVVTKKRKMTSILSKSKARKNKRILHPPKYKKYKCDDLVNDLSSILEPYFTALLEHKLQNFKKKKPVHSHKMKML